MNDICDKYAIAILISRERMYDGDELVLGTWKHIKEHIKKVLLAHRKKKRIGTYMGKEMQSKIYKGFEAPSHQWMKCNINPAKVSTIINIQEQMIKTRTWRRNRGLVVDTDLCRLCSEVPEGSCTSPPEVKC